MAGKKWRFFRVGGFDQVCLDRGEDIAALDELDQKLWVALSCPTGGLELDEKTLSLLDTDNDGRLRPPEILAAAKWVASVLRDPAELTKGGDAIALSAIDDRSDEGKTLVASAKQILADLGKGHERVISLADVADTAKIFAQTNFNGDGIIPVSSADDEATQKAIADILASVGAEPDRSGKDGVSAAKVTAFFEAAASFDAWWKRAEAQAATVLVLGDATDDAAQALRTVRAKVDDYFTRCRLAAFDPRAVGPLNRDEAEYVPLASRELSSSGEEVAGFPLAKVAPEGRVPLGAALNPAWAEAVAALRTKVVVALLGERDALTEGDWATLCAKLAPFEAWRAERSGAEVEALGLARVRELLSGGARATIEALIAKDEALRPEADAIASVEKLLRLHRDLHTLLNNFVSFGDFYAKKKTAIFQVGTLLLDQRSYELCIRVTDAAAHATLATLSKTYLLYCDCTRKATGEKMTIAAAVTNGDPDDLMVGRNGIFYDRKGNDWDATIVKIVEHPIGIRQAFFLPYKRLGRLVGEQLEKFAASRDKELQEKTAANVESANKAAEASTPSPAPAVPPVAPPPRGAFDVARFAGIFAAIGLALGAIGSALAAVAAGFLSLRLWQMPLVVLGLGLLVSGPSMLSAWLKLRQRSIGPLLDANGWAVNARAKMNIPFGASLTQLATLPPGAERSLDDPYAEKKQPWRLYLVVLALGTAAIVLWRMGYFARFVK